jgi:hypothetical protein
MINAEFELIRTLVTYLQHVTKLSNLQRRQLLNCGP